MAKLKKQEAGSFARRKFEVRAIIAELNQKYGEGSVALASEAVNMEIEFISTGNYALDFIIPGGIPKNRISQFVGAFSSGKTTTLLKTIAEFQKEDDQNYAAIIDVENALDLKYARALGVDLGRLLIIRPDSGEQAVDLLIEMLKNDINMLVGVDSIPAIVPFAEIDSTIDQNFMGKHPQLINRMVKMCNARLKRSLSDPDAPSTTVILLNQVREKIGVMFGNPETTPGGKGKDFFAGLTIRFSGGEKIAEKVVRGGITKEIMVGREFRAVTQKNKVGGRPFEECTYRYFSKKTDKHDFGTYDNEKVLLEYGLFHEVISLSDSGVMRYKSKTKGEIAFKRESDFIKGLKANPAISRALYRAILRTMKEESDKERGITDDSSS